MNTKTNIRTALRTALIIFGCGVVLFAFSYAYLSLTADTKQQAETKKDDIPYESHPENSGILFCLPDGDGCLLYLDFASQKSFVAFLPEVTGKEIQFCGYSIDHSITVDYTLLAGIIDRIGGLTLTVNQNTMRYTGIQIIELISENGAPYSIKKPICEAILQQISKNGFSNDDFVYIMEQSETDLTVPDCLEWQEDFPLLCSRVNFINEPNEEN